MQDADTDVVNSPPDAGLPGEPGRAGRVCVLLAFLILGVAAGIYGWLAITHRLEDLAEQPPAIVVDIPALAPAAPVETGGGGAPAAAVAGPTPLPEGASGGSGAAPEAAASATTPPSDTGEAPPAMPPAMPGGAASSAPTLPSPPAPTEPGAPDAPTSEMATTSRPETSSPPQKPAPTGEAASAAPAPAPPSTAPAPAASPPASTESAAATLTAPPATIAQDRPWRRYAAAFPADDPRPRVALVVTGLGLSSAATRAAIQQLPRGVTLAFSPYTSNLQQWVMQARDAGHEVLIELPMEPMNYPADDPGPQAMLSSLPPAANLQRLDWVLSRADGVAGVVANMGSRFAADAQLMRPVLMRLAERGFLYVDNRTAPVSAVPDVARGLNLPWAANTRFVDAEATRVAIDGRLQQLERTARENGAALALAQPYPVTIERVVAWAQSLEVKGLALAPASALVKIGSP